MGEASAILGKDSYSTLGPGTKFNPLGLTRAWTSIVYFCLSLSTATAFSFFSTKPSLVVFISWIVLYMVNEYVLVIFVFLYSFLIFVGLVGDAFFKGRGKALWQIMPFS